MKALVILSLGGALLAGCATTETGDVTRTSDGTPVYGLNDQPQTAVAGEGTLMPGAYGSRHMQSGQFTGRERTNDQIGQRPTLPREADARQLARDGGVGTGAGALGQSGIVPGLPVTSETLLETEEAPPATPGHAVVVPPGSETPIEQEESVGNSPPAEASAATSDEVP
jgi:hypothetical protein